MSARLHTLITGKGLAELIDTMEDDVRPIIDEFLYEEEVMMIAADPGAGKSVIALQTILALSSGQELFGELAISKPRKVYYFQLEGSLPEFMSRIRKMRDVCDMNTENIIWDMRKIMNVMDSGMVKSIIADMKAHAPIDIVIIDPIYKCVAGAIASEEPAKAIIAFSDLLREEFGCALLFIHHTHRERRSSDGKVIEESDPFYGSQWLKAYIDVGYHFRRVSGSSSRSVLNRKKDRNSKVRNMIPLSFNHESFTLEIEHDKGKMTSYERVLKYLTEQRSNGAITFNTVVDGCDISAPMLKKVQRQLIDNGVLRCDKRDKFDKRTKIWELIDDRKA